MCGVFYTLCFVWASNQLKQRGNHKKMFGIEKHSVYYCAGMLFELKKDKSISSPIKEKHLAIKKGEKT